ncbi:MAG: hypothetical protein FAZ92_00606 [Accumulibacter sp.]|nr:MAG: hypothetical protein FAZ92_00606 [Accumulibacter sp.]
MDVEHRLPLLVAHLLDDVVPGVTGVVDDDVEAAELAERRLHEALGEIGGGDAADAGDRLAAGRDDVADGLCRRCGVDIIDHHMRALRRQLERHRATDAAAGAADDRHLACEFCHELLPVD